MAQCLIAGACPRSDHCSSASDIPWLTQASGGWRIGCVTKDDKVAVVVRPFGECFVSMRSGLSSDRAGDRGRRLADRSMKQPIRMPLVTDAERLRQPAVRSPDDHALAGQPGDAPGCRSDADDWRSGLNIPIAIGAATAVDSTQISAVRSSFFTPRWPLIHRRFADARATAGQRTSS